MKLMELNPSWVRAGGEGVTRNGQPVPERRGVGMSCNCPCGCSEPLYVPFVNPLDGGPNYSPERPGWARTGDTFETLTLSPSIRRVGGCNWHGWIRNGESVNA